MALNNKFVTLTTAAILSWLPAHGQQWPFGDAGVPQNHPIYLSGRVMLENGATPAKPVAIQRRCGALPITEGYADSRGYFNLQLQPFIPREPQDATGATPLQGSLENTDDNLRVRDLLGCRLGAQLAGYQSQWIDLGRRRALDNPDIGVILLHRVGASEGTNVSSTGRTAPTAARKAYKNGLELEKKNRLEDARANFEEAAARYPGYAAAWNELGRVQAALGQLEKARTSFAHSIAADEKYVLPYLHLSALEYHDQRWQQLADISEKALALDSFHYPQAFFWNAAANYNLDHLEDAEKSARRAEQLDTGGQVPEVYRLLGLVLAERHDFLDAAGELRKYLKLAPNATDGDEIRSRLEEIEQTAHRQ